MEYSHYIPMTEIEAGPSELLRIVHRHIMHLYMQGMLRDLHVMECTSNISQIR